MKRTWCVLISNTEHSQTIVTCYFMENFKTICQVQKLSSMIKQGKSQSQ